MTEKVISQKIEKQVKELSDTVVSNLEKELLSDADLLLKDFTEQSPNMIFINKGGRVVYVNNQCEKLMGYSKVEFLSPDFDFMRLIAPESAELVMTNFRLHMKGQDLAPYEYVLINKEGEKIDAIITSKLIDYKGEQAILGIVTDITDRKQAEKSLRESEESYRKLIFEMCNAFVLNQIEFDQNGMPVDCRFLEINPAFENITGLSANDILGKAATEVFPGTKSFWLDRCGEIAISGKPVQFKNGSKLFGRFFEVIAYSPQKGQVATVFTDITDRMKIENSLRESETNFRTIAENATDAILIAVKRGQYVYVNQRASEITGYSIPELLGMSYRDLVHPDEMKRVDRIFKNRMAEKSVPYSYETLILKKDKTSMPIEVSGANTFWKGQPAIMVAIRDITLRKRFEEALGKINRELEHRVEERTLELMDIAEKMEEKQRELLRHKLDLEKANKELVQTNTALSVLARNIDKKRDEVENKIAQTISAQIMPLIDELKNDKIPEKSRVKLDVLSAYLNDLTPEAVKGHDIIISLSAMELRVAMMIKNGFSSDEIARLLHISPHTVKTHRRSIRKKLNITNSNINLSSYLRLKLGKASHST
jgi:PAS domain S-box-containing protein